jgi:hypothetical protein
MVQLHIILDIDQTLIDSMQKENYNKIKSSVRKPDYYCESNGLVVWERSNLKEFLNYLDKNVRYLSIWTNGSRGWLEYVLKNILSRYINHRRFLHLVSVEFSDRKLITDLNQIVLVKDIKKLLNKFPRKNINLKNTILIDDNIYNCFYNKDNTIPLKKFLIKLERVDSKRSLAFNFLINIIEVLKKSEDVSITLNRVYGDLSGYDKLFG